MKNVGLFLATFRQSQALKTSVGERAVVIARFVAGHGRDGFNADAKEIVRECLEEWQRFRH